LQKDDALPGPRYRLAQYAISRADTQEAKAYLVSELNLAPEETDILVSMGSMFLMVGDTEISTKCLLRALNG